MFCAVCCWLSDVNKLSDRLTDVGAAAACQSTASIDQSQTDVVVDVSVGCSDSESQCINIDAVANQQSADDVMQTAEDILDELTEYWHTHITLTLLVVGQQEYLVDKNGWEASLIT